MIIGFGILIYACYCWIKLIWFLFPNKPKQTNPYINAHKTIIENDKNYNDYLDWLENKSGVPIEKIMHPEEKRANQQIKNLLK